MPFAPPHLSSLPRALLLCLALLAPAAWAQPGNCSDIELIRSMLTDQVQEREPGDPVASLAGLDALLAFTEVRNARGRTIIHEWRYQGEPVAEVKLTVRGDRWRTWSSKNLGVRRTPEWSVAVRTDDGCLLDTLSLATVDAQWLDAFASQVLAGDLLAAKQALSEAITARPEAADALKQATHPWLSLGAARKDVKNDQLYLARSRLASLASEDKAFQHARRETLTELAQREKALERDAAIELEALEAMTRKAPLPCSLTRSELDRWLEQENGRHFAVMDRTEGTNRQELELLDQRTGKTQALVVHCVSLPAD